MSCSAIYNQTGWIYNEPGRVYDDCGISEEGQELQCRARISKLNDASIDCRAYILGPATLAVKARIQADDKIDLRARVSRQQGWPIPSDDDPASLDFTPTQLLLRARLSGASFAASSISPKGRIRLGDTINMSARGHIVPAQNCTIRARIRGVKDTSVGFTFDVRQTQEFITFLRFYVPGNYYEKNLSMRGKITRTASRRMTGIFTVVQGNNNKSYNTFVSGARSKTLQSIGVRAGIVR